MPCNFPRSRAFPYPRRDRRRYRLTRGRRSADDQPRRDLASVRPMERGPGYETALHREDRGSRGRGVWNGIARLDRVTLAPQPEVFSSRVQVLHRPHAKGRYRSEGWRGTYLRRASLQRATKGKACDETRHRSTRGTRRRRIRRRFECPICGGGHSRADHEWLMGPPMRSPYSSQQRRPPSVYEMQRYRSRPTD